MRRPSPPIAAILFAVFLGIFVFSVLPALAAANLTIAPITWNVVGLDSNDVTTGPNNFPVGARVCNTGDTTATNVTSTFVWDTADAFIDSRPGSKTSYTGADAVASLAAGACHDFYYEVQITRNSSAYDHTREYHITADADSPIVPISTSTPREIFVEHLISQSRNSTNDVKLDTVSIPAGGSMSLVVGGTYDIQLIASTATNGYEQIESFINFPNTIFQINSVAATYSANGGTDPDALTKLYADGCSWENDPNSPNYRSCLSTGKYGGSVTLDYNITVIGGGGTTQTLNTLIYDFSGSSYHYNADFSTSARIAHVIDPTAMTISKAFAPDPTIVGGTSTLTFTIGNPNAAEISDVNFSDTFPTSPGAMVVANPTGASTTGCGTPTFSPVAGAGSISFSDGTVPANGNCIVSVSVTVPTVGTYNNTSDNLFVGTTDTGKNASDSLVVNTDPPPPSPVCGLVMAAWDFATITDPIGSPAPSTQAADVGTAAITFGGTVPASVTGVADSSSGNPVNSVRMYGWQNAGPIVTSTSPYIQFEIDTSNYTQVNLSFDLERKSNGPDSEELFYDSGSGLTLKTTFSSTTSWASYGAYDFTGQASTTGNTSFRLYGYGANTPSSGADLNIDNVSFTGCGVPNPPTITKDFSPDPVAVSDTSTLSFTVTNPNATLALSGIAFSDTLPAGVIVATSGPTATCGGSLSTTSPDTIAFTGGSLAGGENCVIPVTVTVTTSGPHLNVSGFISATETGTNTGSGGSASDSITAISPPSISKLFNPNPILTGGTSTLTFSIINPNPDDQLTGVAFSDTFPTSPGAMVVANPTGASTTDCGSPAYTPVAAAGSISFTGGTIAAGGTCTVTVDVTATPTGDYANTSGAVSATTAGTGNTASDSLTVNPVNPDISILKQVGTSITGPWTTFVAVTTGSNIYYQMTVENIGDVALTGVNVTDPTLTGLSVDLSGCTWANMPLYDVQTCVVGPVTAVAGSHANTATSHGTYSATEYDSSPSTATYATTGLTLTKSVAESFFTAAGETLNYSYLVNNNGSAPLAGPVVVSDDLSTDESCPDVSTVGDGDAFLDPGESITCTATYTTTAGDVAAGSVTNTASAAVDGVTSNQDDETVPINKPDLQVSKTNNVGGSGPLGTDYTWTITVSNVGPVAAVFADGQTILSDDPLPSGPTYGTPQVVNDINVTDPLDIDCSIVSDVLTCDASGAAVTIGATTGTFDVTVVVTPDSAGDLDNTAEVDPGLVIDEGDETNNEDSDTVTVIGPPSIAKTFSPDSIAVGATSSLQFTITNANAGTALTDVAFTDTLPAGATVASATTSECGGTLTVTALDSIALSGGSIAASSNCVFSVTVTGATAGSKSNTTGNVSSTNGGTGNTAADTLTVVSPPSIAKVFSPDSIAVGGTSSLQFTITNANTGTALTGVAFTDTLPAGATVASATTSECGGTLTVTAPSSIALSGGSIAASSNCVFSVTVTGATAGSKANTTGNVSSTNGGTGNTASDTLTVIGPPSIAKVFSPDSIAVGGTSSLQFTITNANAGIALAGVAFTDTLPAGATVVSAITSECGGTLTVTAPSSIALSGGSIAASSNCVFSVTVTGATAGSKANTTGNVSSTNGGTGNTATDTLTVIGGPSIAKVFSPDSIAEGASSSLQFTITNSNTGTALTGVAFTDTLPAGATVASATTSECGGTLTVTALDLIALSGGSIAASSNCVFSVTVTGATAGSKVNTTGTVTSTNGGDGNTASDTLTVIGPPSIAKVFSPDSIAVGGTSSLQFTITNANAGTTLTGVAFSDSLPAGATAASATTSECGGTLTVTAPDSIALSGGSIASSSNCVFSVTVTGATAGSKVNTTGTVTSTNGGDGNTASDMLTVVSPPLIAKVFSPDSIALGATSSLQFTITNSNGGTALTGVAFTDTLPAGATVASATTSECGGTLTVTAPSSIALSGGSIAASSNCVFSVTVTGATAGSKVNTTGTVSSTNGGDGNTGSDTLAVISPPSIAKVFSPDSITTGDTSSLQFTITNSNAGTALTGVAFTDSLPAGVTVTSATTSECGGTLTVTAPASIVLSGGSIASSANCVFSVTVTGATVGVKVNSTGIVSSTNGGSGNTATDTLTVSAPTITDPAVTKSVSPSTAAIGDTVTFTLFVSNGGPGDAADVELVDTIPAFLEITLVTTVPSPVSTLISGNTVTIDFGTVTPSDTYTVTITTVVRDSATPQIGTNTADITTSSPESDTDNNSDSVPITIVVASPPLEAPETGFAPNRITSLPIQPAAKAHQTYGELRLEIPALGAEMSIVGIPKDSEGWDVTWLANQAGYLAGTAFPTWSGNSVITGHNTLASGINGPFAQLEELEYGDQIVVSAWGMRHIYEVREEDWVRPTDSSIFRHEERPWVTLLTCDDWDERTETYRMRHLVRAVLMRVEPMDSESDTPME